MMLFSMLLPERSGAMTTPAPNVPEEVSSWTVKPSRVTPSASIRKDVVRTPPPKFSPRTTVSSAPPRESSRASTPACAPRSVSALSTVTSSSYSPASTLIVAPGDAASTAA
jgi:hypothetical protein